jgi:hypothetical protein
MKKMTDIKLYERKAPGKPVMVYHDSRETSGAAADEMIDAADDFIRAHGKRLMSPRFHGTKNHDAYTAIIA